jgi:predicted nucleic acid-binding protein
VIVVDTNLIACLFIAGEHSEEAEKVLAKDPEWSAPLLWRSELRSVLVKCVRRELLGIRDAFLIMAEAESLMAGNEYAVASADVLESAASTTCSAYDVEFIVLAREAGAPLVTVDKALLAAFPETAVAPSRFLASRKP